MPLLCCAVLRTWRITVQLRAHRPYVVVSGVLELLQGVASATGACDPEGPVPRRAAIHGAVNACSRHGRVAVVGFTRCTAPVRVAGLAVDAVELTTRDRGVGEGGIDTAASVAQQVIEKLKKSHPNHNIGRVRLDT